MTRIGDLERHDRLGGGWWLPLAVTSAAVVGLALAAALLLGHRAEETAEPSAPLTSRIGLAARAALVALGSDATEFETARAELLEVLDSRRDSLPEETQTTLTENLAIIEAQIEAISEELNRDPENPRLARMLAAAYQRELELLQLAAALPTMSRSADES